MLAPTAWREAFRSPIDSVITCRRSSGSSHQIGSVAIIAETRLPSAPRSSAARTPIGTIARSPREQGVGEKLGVARLGLGDPRLGRGLRPGLGLDVVEDRAYVNPGDAVDEAVMALADDGEAIAFDAVDQPHLPDRLRAVEPLRE